MNRDTTWRFGADHRRDGDRAGDDGGSDALRAVDADGLRWGRGGPHPLGGHDAAEGGIGGDVAWGQGHANAIREGEGTDRIEGGAGDDGWGTRDFSAGGRPRDAITRTPADRPGDGVRPGVGGPHGHGHGHDHETQVPCFTPGTRIATPKGEVPVERLKAGDRVITRDNGIQEIKWVGDRPLRFVDLAREQHLRPIRIRAGALGRGLPERDMLLSPNHRVLVANERTALYFDEREVLAAAKYLVDSKGVEVVEPMGVTYLHFMCARHEVVLSDGAWTESFQPGDRTLRGMGNAQRQELFELFPELKTEEGLDDYAAARPILKKHEANLLRD